MVRRGVLILLLVAGVFGGSAAAGFLLAKGALRHAPAAAAPGTPDASRSGVSQPAAIPPETTGSGTATGPAAPGPAGGPVAAGAATATAPAPPAGGAAAGASAAGGPVEPAVAQPNTSPPPTPRSTPPAPTAPPRAPDAGPVISGRLHVQVAEFPERQNADALALSLRARGFAVTVTDGPPYRVWVGGYLDRATAERLAAYLRQSGLVPTLVPQ